MLNVEGLRNEKCGGVRTHYAGGDAVFDQWTGNLFPRETHENACDDLVKNKTKPQGVLEFNVQRDH